MRKKCRSKGFLILQDLKFIAEKISDGACNIEKIFVKLKAKKTFEDIMCVFHPDRSSEDLLEFYHSLHTNIKCPETLISHKSWSLHKKTHKEKKFICCF